VNKIKWITHNPSGRRRVVVTKELPGTRWLDRLIRADCQVEVCTSTDILSTAEIITAIGNRCDGAIGQLTENWGTDLFEALKIAGGRARISPYSLEIPLPRPHRVLSMQKRLGLRP